MIKSQLFTQCPLKFVSTECVNRVEKRLYNTRAIDLAQT